jgi:hypothetical protein
LFSIFAVSQFATIILRQQQLTTMTQQNHPLRTRSTGKIHETNASQLQPASRYAWIFKMAHLFILHSETHRTKVDILIIGKAIIGPSPGKHRKLSESRQSIPRLRPNSKYSNPAKAKTNTQHNQRSTKENFCEKATDGARCRKSG